MVRGPIIPNLTTHLEYFNYIRLVNNSFQVSKKTVFPQPRPEGMAWAEQKQSS